MYMSSNPALLAVLAGRPSALAATFTGRPSDETSRHSSLLDAAKAGCVRTRSSVAFRQAKSHKMAQSRLVDVLEPLPRPIVFAGGKIRCPPNPVSRRICEKVLFPVACAIHHAQYTISGTASATGVYTGAAWHEAGKSAATARRLSNLWYTVQHVVTTGASHEQDKTRRD